MNFPQLPLSQPWYKSTPGLCNSLLATLMFAFQVLTPSLLSSIEQLKHAPPLVTVTQYFITISVKFRKKTLLALCN